MKIANKTILITGANRGIGLALVEEALNKGARRVYAATRSYFAHSDKRVTPLMLDVTDTMQIREAVREVGALDILINNAGLGLKDDLSNTDALENQLAVNLFGTYHVTQAFLPMLTRSKGAVVNNLSISAIAPFALIPAYCISKAAAFSLTQCWRALLAGKGVSVHAVLIGPTETEMARGLKEFNIPHNPVAATAQGIYRGLENGEEEIFPDPISASLSESWYGSVTKALERQNAAMVADVLLDHWQGA
jgi:NAD(P)-dependent dehydrogenase (short-subunit alcohol dehydrogenase family)